MHISVFTPDGVTGCTVTAWLHKQRNPGEIPQRSCPGIVICPGGGYEFVSAREAEPVAIAFYKAGYNTFILEYSVKEKAKDFLPLTQLASTFAHIRSHSDALLTTPGQIAVIGFSAGGHLAASLGTLHNEPVFLSASGLTVNIRPDAMILGYPVITADEFTHVSSIEHVSGSPKGSDRYHWFDLTTHVDSATPPAFLWHTAEDELVPVENSLKMMMALSKHKVPFECHIFPNGGHGMSVCSAEVGCRDDYNSRWVDMGIQWLNRLFSFEN